MTQQKKFIKSSQLAFLINSFNDNLYPSDLDFYENEVKGNEIDFIKKLIINENYSLHYVDNPDITEHIIYNDIKAVLKVDKLDIRINSELSNFRKTMVYDFEFSEKDVYLLKSYKINFIYDRKRVEIKFTLNESNNGQIHCDNFTLSINYKEEVIRVDYYWLMLACLSKIK